MRQLTRREGEWLKNLSCITMLWVAALLVWETLFGGNLPVASVKVLLATVTVYAALVFRAVLLPAFAASQQADKEGQRGQGQLLNHRPVAFPGRPVSQAEDNDHAGDRHAETCGPVLERQRLKSLEPLQAVFGDRLEGREGFGGRLGRWLRRIGRCFGEFFRGGVHRPTLPAVSTDRNS